jgi:hypothetical protein
MADIRSAEMPNPYEPPNCVTDGRGKRSSAHRRSARPSLKSLVLLLFIGVAWIGGTDAGSNNRVDRSGVWVQRDGWFVLSPLGHPERSWANPSTAENSVGRSFPARRRWLRSDLSATASPSPGSFGVPAARGWTEIFRFRWKTSVGRSTCPGRRWASIGSSGIGIPGIGKNVRLLARNRVVTAMAGPDRIPGRGTRKKMLATAAAAR